MKIGLCFGLLLLVASCSSDAVVANDAGSTMDTGATGMCGVDDSTRGMTCDPATPGTCGTGYVCEGFANEHYECALPCNASCTCPAGLSCEMFSDDAGAHSVCS